MNSLHRLLNYEIGRLDCHVITTKYRKRVHCIHSNALVHVIYSGVSGKCSGVSGKCSGVSGQCSGVSGQCLGVSGQCSGVSGQCSYTISTLSCLK